MIERVVRASFFYLLAVLLIGSLAGLLWWVLAKPPAFTIGDDLGAIITERGLAQVFNIDIWFVLIGLALGLILGTITWFSYHRLSWPVVIVAIAGAVLAGLLALNVGHLLGPYNFAERVAVAKPGDLVVMDLDLHSPALLLVWPFAASVGTLLFAIWGRVRPRRKSTTARVISPTAD